MHKFSTEALKSSGVLHRLCCTTRKRVPGLLNVPVGGHPVADPKRMSGTIFTSMAPLFAIPTAGASYRLDSKEQIKYVVEKVRGPFDVH